MQWGSSYVTLSPRQTDETGLAERYFGTIDEVYTISEWGSYYTTAGAPVPLEFKYYQVKSDKRSWFVLEEDQVKRIMSQNFFLRGMNNMYNSVGFAILDHCDFFDETTRWHDTYNVKQKDYFSKPMQYMI